LLGRRQVIAREGIDMRRADHECAILVRWQAGLRVKDQFVSKIGRCEQSAKCYHFATHYFPHRHLSASLA
jgi:hypothetical protein